MNHLFASPVNRGSHFPPSVVDLSKLVQKEVEIHPTLAFLIGMCVRDMMPAERPLKEIVPEETINRAIRIAIQTTKPSDWEPIVAFYMAQMFALVVNSEKFPLLSPLWHAEYIKSQEAIAAAQTPEQAREVCNEGGTPCHQDDCSYCNHLPDREVANA